MNGIVRVSFKKTISDDHFGGEMAEVCLELELEPNEDDAQLAETLLTEARRLVHAELGRSPSAQVRRGVPQRIPVMTVPAEPDDEGDEVPL